MKNTSHAVPAIIWLLPCLIVWPGIGKGGGAVLAQQEERQGNPVRASLYYEQAAEVTSDPSSPQAEESRERKQERALGEEKV